MPVISLATLKIPLEAIENSSCLLLGDKIRLECEILKNWIKEKAQLFAYDVFREQNQKNLINFLERDTYSGNSVVLHKLPSLWNAWWKENSKHGFQEFYSYFDDRKFSCIPSLVKKLSELDSKNRMSLVHFIEEFIDSLSNQYGKSEEHFSMNREQELVIKELIDYLDKRDHAHNELILFLLRRGVSLSDDDRPTVLIYREGDLNYKEVPDPNSHKVYEVYFPTAYGTKSHGYGWERHFDAVDDNPEDAVDTEDYDSDDFEEDNSDDTDEDKNASRVEYRLIKRNNSGDRSE
jgi:hypothetical protein